MIKNIRFLGVLLAMQAALILVVFWPRAQGGDTDVHFLMADEPFSEIIIQDNDGGKLVLKKQEEAWILPDYANLQVEPKKIANLLDPLNASYRLVPVANTLQSQERFEVSDKKYQRLVILKNNSGMQTIYVGNQAGVKRSYIRADGSENIYEFPLAHHELSAQAKDWFNTGLLRLNGLNKVQGPDYTLLKNDQGWQLESLAAGKTLKQDNIDVIITQLQYINVLGLASKDDIAKCEKPKQTITVGSEQGENHYQLYKVEDRWLIKADFDPHYFYVADPFARSVVEWRKSSFESSEASS